ncbi:MAG: helix-turn-helix domain-containing protein [Planctomycetes bacterium]|nr:helix-turn-helix domain-containing protein [Planctomycetota bacterium]
MNQEFDLLTARELAKRLRVSTDTVRAWARRGVIPSLRLSPKVIRYKSEEVLSALSIRSAKAVCRGQ